jgi:hypothetical protein
MNYSEKYELRWKGAAGGWKVLSKHDTEAEATAAMKVDSVGVTGAWRVVRISEVTVATEANA